MMPGNYVSTGGGGRFVFQATCMGLGLLAGIRAGRHL